MVGMNERELLFLGQRLPARLTGEQVGHLMGFTLHEVSLLMRLGLLRPLGRPAANGHKYYPAVEIETFSRDRDWLDKANRAIVRSVREKNRKAGFQSETPENSNRKAEKLKEFNRATISKPLTPQSEANKPEVIGGQHA